MNPPPTLIIDTMRYWLLKPSPLLGRQVYCYFVVDTRGDAYTHNELLLPDGYAEIVFAFSAGYERWGIGEATPRDTMRRSYLIGGRSHTVCTSGSQQLHLIGVKLDPRFLRQLISTPLDQFCDTTLTLRDLNHRPLLELEDAMAGCRSIPEVQHSLDACLLGALRKRPQRDQAVDRLLARIHAQRGIASIEHCAMGIALDERTLVRRFSAAMGMPPKRYARIVRFKHAYHSLITSVRTRSVLRYVEGFYDQSHFNKECQYFTGSSPTELLKARFSTSTAVTEHLLRGDLGQPA